MKKYIIWAPKYYKSNGIKVLYKLHDLLLEKGYDVYMYAQPTEYKCKYISHITNKMRKNDIVIYPEIVFNNPLKFQNVVRYILYYPGVNGGTKQYDDYELKFTFYKLFYPDADELFISTLDTKTFYKDDTEKTKECYFVYKGGKWKDIPEFKDMTEINMQFPETKEELAKLLRETKTLYSFDDCSLLLEEANICGCDVKIVRENGFEDYHSNYIEKLTIQDKCLLNFIEKTQKMNYKGKINKPPISNLYFYIKENYKLFVYKYIFKNKLKYDKHLARKLSHSINEYN